MNCGGVRAVQRPESKRFSWLILLLIVGLSFGFGTIYGRSLERDAALPNVETAQAKESEPAGEEDLARSLPELELSEEAAAEKTAPSVSACNAAGQLDLNRASAAELETLPGIGPVKAEAILAYRQDYGGFDSVDELLRVSGIGEKTLAELRDLVYVE